MNENDEIMLQLFGEEEDAGEAPENKTSTVSREMQGASVEDSIYDEVMPWEEDAEIADNSMDDGIEEEPVPAQAGKTPLTDVKVHSAFAGKDMTLQGYAPNSDPDSFVITHTSLKRAMLRLMVQTTSNPKLPPINYSYNTISSEKDHCVVNCSFTFKNYQVTETGESLPETLQSSISRQYPYLEAQRRAFDRAAISFLQLDMDGRAVYSDSEIKN